MTLTGSVRWRGELDGRNFAHPTPLSDIAYLRTRLALGFTPTDMWSIYIQMQNSHDFGANSGYNFAESDLGIHQSYIELKNLFIRNLMLQIGRFEISYGRERLIGVSDWFNVGRTWDGGRISYGNNTLNLEIVSLKIRDSDPYYVGRRDQDSLPVNARDWNLYIIYSSFFKRQLDLFFILNWDKNNGANPPRYHIWIQTAGLYINHSFKNSFSIKMDAALQWGNIGWDTVRAYLIAGLASYEFSKTSRPSIGLGIDVTSGDSYNRTDHRSHEFDNLFYSVHQFRGYMGYFPTNRSGLIDLFPQASISPISELQISSEWHYFRTTENYLIGYIVMPESKVSRKLGNELDLTAIYKYYKDLTLQGGASFFFPSRDWKPSGNTTLWFYGMITAAF